MKKLFIFPFTLLVTLASWSQLAPGNPPAWCTLGWTASPSPGVNNYNIYYGTAPGVYSVKVPAGNVTTFTVTNLNRGFTYYAAVTASDTNGLESTFSNEVWWQVPNPPLAPTNQQITGGHH